MMIEIMTGKHIIILLSAYLLTVTSVPWLIKLARKTNLLDDPSGDALKIHRKPIPVLGGMAIFIAVIISLGVGSVIWKLDGFSVLMIAAALTMVFVIGLIDDSVNLRPGIRVIVQLIAGVMLFWGNDAFANISSHWWLSALVSLPYIMLAINAMNLIDGIDGLATGVAMVASVGFLVGFISVGHVLGTLLSLSLIGATAGFLFFNFNPARIFLGDNGSTILGLLLGLMASLYTTAPSLSSHFVFPILLLLVPLFETLSTILRRLKNHKPIFSGDRDHFYDYLINMGFSPKQTTLLFYGISIGGVCAAVGLIKM